MKRFGVLLVKELWELVTPQTVLPIVLVVIVFMGLGKVTSQQAKLQKQPQSVLVIDDDDSPVSAGVVELLRRAKLDVTLEKQAARPDFARPISQKAVIMIPAGFGKALSAGQEASLESYTIQNGFSVARLVDSQLVSGAVVQVNAALAAARLQQALPRANPAAVLAPVKNDEHIVVAGKVANISPAKVVAYLNSQIAFVPVVLFIVILFAGQMVATAMANEKENKTLETLLSVPISRTTIVGAKMLAAGIVASVTAAAYVYGLNSVQSSFTGGQAADAATKAAISQLGLNLPVQSYLLLGVALFLGILTALAIALVLGAFADNIKSVQSLIMPLMVLLLIPYLASMVVDIQTLPVVFKVILYAIPFTYTFQALPNLYVHNYGLVVLGSAYELACFVVFMLLAAKLFSSDQLLTLRLGWLIRKK
jgi:ABC-2 type transport system permease protein